MHFPESTSLKRAIFAVGDGVFKDVRIRHNDHDVRHSHDTDRESLAAPESLGALEPGDQEPRLTRANGI